MKRKDRMVRGSTSTPWGDDPRGAQTAPRNPKFWSEALGIRLVRDGAPELRVTLGGEYHWENDFAGYPRTDDVYARVTTRQMPTLGIRLAHDIED